MRQRLPGSTAFTNPPFTSSRPDVSAAGEAWNGQRQEALPAVDIIILSLNRVTETIAAIESCLSQNYANKHVFVLDQGSDARVLEQLRGYTAGRDGLTFVALGRNEGVPGGRNILSEMGNAPIIVALDNDAEFADDACIERVVSRFEEAPHAGAIAFRILNYYTGEDDLTSWSYPNRLLPRANERFRSATFVGAGHACRRNAFETAGGYDDALFFMWEETDLCRRLINAGWEIWYEPEIRVRHKVSAEGRVMDGSRYWRHVRNRMYIDWKYERSAARLVAYGLGYLARGARNGLLVSAVLGLWRLIPMLRRISRQDPARRLALSPVARRYLREHDRVHRGTFLNRLRSEVFARHSYSRKRAAL